MRFAVDRLDHLVLAVRDTDISAAWYQRVMGMETDPLGDNDADPREGDGIALRFGGQVVMLRTLDHEATPRAGAMVAGAADLCFATALGWEDVVAHLHDCGVAVELGPVPRVGALGPIRSVYCRDPDRNLIEIASYFGD